MHLSSNGGSPQSFRPSVVLVEYRGCCVPPKNGGGGGEEEAPSLSTGRGAPQNGDGPDQTDVALMRLVALPRHKKNTGERI